MEEEEDEEVEEEEEEDEGKVVYFLFKAMTKCMLSMMAFYLHYLKNMIELNYILLRYRWWIQLQLSSNLRFLTNLSPGPNRRMCAFSTDHSEDS